ncbi:MAG: metal ABC transporter substrate-binding protein [Cyanobacteria bacterium J06642_2]
MTTRRRTLLKSVAALVALCFVAPATAQEREPTPVVATFSILGDMVERIGEEHVNVTTLVGPGGDAHVYQPTPADARAVQDAEVMIVNGLEFEGWLDRLADAAEFDGSLVVATTGIEAIAFEDEHGDEHDDHHDEEHAEGKHDDEHDEHDEHGDEHDEEHAEGKHDDEHGDGHDEHDHGAFDPHAWLSLENAVIYVDNITAALAKADPANATTFYSNRATYVEEIEALDADIRAMMAALPEDARTVVTSHDAFQYFGRDYGLTFLAPQGLSTESEASAQDVARLIEQMRADEIGAAFVENVADPRLLEQIANETGATIGGTLYPGALSAADGPATTYLDLMRHNATTLSTALGS